MIISLGGCTAIVLAVEKSFVLGRRTEMLSDLKGLVTCIILK